MRNRSVGKYFSIVCVLAASLSANLVFADWSMPQQQGNKRQGYGDFPPKDIEQLIQQENLKSDNIQTAGQLKEDQSKDSSTAGSQPSASNTADPYNYQQGATQNLPGQTLPAQNNQVPNYGNYQMPNYGNYQMPYYGSYGDGRNLGPRGSGPWNNRGSGFSAPWGNNGSSFSGPWNNRGSSFSGPWNNNGSSFSGPWDNNNGSSFGPFGN